MMQVHATLGLGAVDEVLWQKSRIMKSGHGPPPVVGTPEELRRGYQLTTTSSQFTYQFYVQSAK
jgi:hypothetical protein